MKYNNQASAQQIESLQQMGYKVSKDKNKERNPTQVVNINVTAGSAEPGQPVAAAPSVSRISHRESYLIIVVITKQVRRS